MDNDEIQIDQCTKDNCFETNLQYAEDVRWVSTEKNRLGLIKKAKFLTSLQKES